MHFLIPLLCLFLITSVSHAAEKPTTAAQSFRSGVVLTFDDRYVDQWVQQIPLFKKYDAHATFFVDHFYKLKPAQIAGLKKLQDAGHAIGSHSVNHIKAVDYVRTKGMKAYLQNEIDPSVKRLTEAGFPPTAFAYPNSSRSEEIDTALLKTFRHLRG
ncbi:MAG: polysaccharide deacetylase family protein, partial [Planctomycetaceae bacterium]|nr:polysaccharide deacetylase family protein [Planctomycetaceae bacterium]